MSNTNTSNINRANNERKEDFSPASSNAGEKTLCANVGNHSGAVLSNTAPPKYTGQYIHPLICGVDSLYLSFQGRLKHLIEDKLSSLKELAQSKSPDESGQAFLEVLDHKFEVRPKGSGNFAFVLDDNWFNIQLSSTNTSNMPLAYVQIKSELLTHHDLSEIIPHLILVIDELGANVLTPAISRLDLYMDFYCLNGFRIENIQIEQWKTRAIQIDRFHQSKRPSGWRIGKGNIMARLYNKTLEIEKSKKDYLKPIWEDRGWNLTSDVWRLEFQFRRHFFTEISETLISQWTIAKTIDFVSPSLWQYGTGDWLQLVEVNPDDSNASRWPMHPAWQEFIEPCACGKPESIRRVRKERVPEDDYLFINGLGAISSFMAREGISDIGEAFGEFINRARVFHEQERNGDIEDYLHKKAFEKTKRYNTTLKE